MLRREIADRQAQWARFGAWEKRQNPRLTRLDGEEAIRAVGEIVEFYLEVAASPLLVQRSVAVKVEGVRCLRRALRSVAPR